MLTFIGPSFEISYPQEWEYEIIENIPSFFCMNQGWALQLASSRFSKETLDIEKEMSFYLEQNDIYEDKQKISTSSTIQGYPYIYYEFTKSSRFWMVYMTCHLDSLLALLWNTDAIPEPVLTQNISDMLHSVIFTNNL